MSIPLILPMGADAKLLRSLKPVAGSVQAEDFVLQDLNGKPVRFSRFRGKVVLLNFWATWCTSCQREMPSMERLYQAYQSRGFVVVAVSLDRSLPSVVKAFVEELGLRFPVLHDPDQTTGRLYGAWGVPFSFLISTKGRIAYRIPGEYDWDARAAKTAVEGLLRDGALITGKK